MVNVTGAVNAHKRHVKSLIYSSTEEVIVRLPVDLVDSGVNPLYGDFNRETDATGTERGPFKCLWYDALSAKSMSSTGSGFETVIQGMAGQYESATAFIEIWLDDVLVDISERSGATWLSRAAHIIYDKHRFEYLGDVRIGLSTTSPYILMAALKGGVGYDE